jgi:hypothetical protein
VATTGTYSDPRSPSSARRRGNAPFALIAAALVLLGVTGFVRLLPGRPRLRGGIDEGAVRPVGVQVHLSVPLWTTSGSASLRSVRPRRLQVLTDLSGAPADPGVPESARAVDPGTVRFSAAWVLGPPGGYGAVGDSFIAGDPTRPVGGIRIGHTYPQIVSGHTWVLDLALTALTPGVYRVDGLDLAYAAGPWHRTAHLDAIFCLYATDPGPPPPDWSAILDACNNDPG